MSAGILGCFGNSTCCDNSLQGGGAVGAPLRRNFGSFRLGLKICVLSEGGDEGLTVASAFAGGGTVLIAASIRSASVDLGLVSTLAGDGAGLAVTAALSGGDASLLGVSALGSDFSNGFGETLGNGFCKALGEALGNGFCKALGEALGDDFAAGRGGGGTRGRLTTVRGSINVPTPMTPTPD